MPHRARDDRERRGRERDGDPDCARARASPRGASAAIPSPARTVTEHAIGTIAPVIIRPWTNHAGTVARTATPYTPARFSVVRARNM